ncbi:hypothetical protein, partial [Sutterella wadsworthensis]|uniref:hypothetical protein n=1 Tax=Sutterella wadsworthensis TaxID=40545 RepID=UPI00307AC427
SSSSSTNLTECRFHGFQVLQGVGEHGGEALTFGLGRRMRNAWWTSAMSYAARCCGEDLLALIHAGRLC